VRKRLKRLAVFVSGRGTNMDNIARQIAARRLRAEIGLVFSDNPKAPALGKARRRGLATACLEPQAFPFREAYEGAVLKILREKKIDFVILAGYMRIVGTTLLQAYPRRILNIHPAILPGFKGTHAIRDAYEYGVQVTGVSVHFVDEKVDHGPIILQKAVPVERNDSLKTLERKIHRVEHELYPQAIRLLLEGRLTVRGRKVVFSAAKRQK
jgi:phosphoribosylglycinamide formyltransferase-1